MSKEIIWRMGDEYRVPEFDDGPEQIGKVMKPYIYVASSWRNERQQEVVRFLREAGFEVYDFKNPAPGDHGFQWSEIDANWKDWDSKTFRMALQHPTAIQGYRSDMDALIDCDVCVLVLPCGRSAHLELGYATGNGKLVFILLDDECEPELMYKMVSLCCDLDELVKKIKAKLPHYRQPDPAENDECQSATQPA